MCDEIENIKYEYVQSNTFRLEHDDEKNETKDGFEVLCDNFLFYRRRKNKDSNYWVCKHKKCNASMTIGFDGKVRSVSQKPHNLQEMRDGVNPAEVHLPLNEFQILTLNFIKKVKLRCSTEDVGANKIFEDEQNKLFKSLKTDEEKTNVASSIPQFHNLKAGLQKRINLFRPKLPISVITTVIDGKYTKCSNGIDNFLIYKTKRNKKLVFCSKTGLEILAKSTEWHADGTFHVATKFYHQLYIIQAWFMNRMIPCAFVLMERRRTKDYDDVFKAINRAASRNNLVLKPEKIMTDLELAAINAFKNQFPGIINKACLFHFAQAILKNFGKLGFKNDYEKNDIVNTWFRQLFCLSVIPPELITEQFEHLLKNIPVFDEEHKNKNMEKFMDYFVDNYFEGSFPIELWNHYNTVGPRTNNNLEGYNNKLKLHVSRAHPNIFKSIEMFQSQEISAFIKYKHALDGKQAPPRKKLDVGKDNELKIFKKLLEEKNITIDIYIKCILPLFSFKKKENIANDETEVDESEDEDEDILDSSDEEDEL